MDENTHFSPIFREKLKNAHLLIYKLRFLFLIFHETSTKIEHLCQG